MRVAFANSSKIWGGAEVITALLLRGLQSRGHDVSLLCRRSSPFLERLGSELPCYATLGGFDANPRSVLLSMRALRRERAEVLVTMTQKEPRTAGIAARLLAMPVLLRQPMDTEFRRTFHHRFFYGMVPTHYVANSRATRRTMLASATWLAPADVGVIYNGIDVERFARAEPAPLGLPAGALLVGFAGRFEKRKGIVDLMAAWEIVARSVPEAHLVLVGAGGALEDDVSAWASGRNRVHRLGFRDDMHNVLAAFDIFVMPSHFEGFGIVLVEAMATGTAVIASAASNLPELVQDGVEGLLVPVRDAAALAAAIISLCSDRELRETMARAARERARRDFSLDRMLGEYEALLQEIVAGGTVREWVPQEESQ
jgi:glycosyltransferase involved in cell wall biosynthesis